MAAVGTLKDVEALDVDLSTREHEGVGGGCALEVAATTVLAGTGLWHGGECGAEALRVHLFWRARVSGGQADSSGFVDRFGAAESVLREEGAAGELHHMVDGVELLQLGGAKVAEEDGVGWAPLWERFCWLTLRVWTATRICCSA
jgi:hypothetical protein